MPPTSEDDDPSFSLLLGPESYSGRRMPPTSEVIVRDSLLSGTLASYGASAVARTSDRGRVAEV